ncbi:protein phosphatase 1 regulatory subunit 15A [Trichomycterus rosablanca]|uniref:protein phosphatase 1 regulatory subunit 15A n=1 Tax=Trichomycterus rosablanca TaxID=2290929 RepID=UPI002F35702A
MRVKVPTMAPFTSDRHHPLDNWWLPQAALYFPSVKKPELSSNMPRRSESCSVNLYRAMSIHPMLLTVSFCLYEALRKVIHRCVSVAELLNMIFFLCAEETMLMMGKSKKIAMKAQERPGLETQNSEMTETGVNNCPEKVTMSTTDVFKPDQSEMDREVMLLDWLEWESDEEQDESDNGSNKNDDGMKEQLQQEDDWETGWNGEEDSDWSDDEQDSEASAESAALWESFFNNSNPYNPLYFSCPSGVKAKVSDGQQNHTPSKLTAGGGEKPVSGEEHRNKCNTHEGTKKVRFNDEVTVHHLVDWSIASQEARDGSCWMEQARDRERFRRRTEKAGESISPCLTAQHRARVYGRLQTAY